MSVRGQRVWTRRMSRGFTPKTCQWIEGEPDVDEPDFCGKPVQEGSSYCPHHHARCWVKAVRPVRKPVKQAAEKPEEDDALDEIDDLPEVDFSEEEMPDAPTP